MKNIVFYRQAKTKYQMLYGYIRYMENILFIYNQIRSSFIYRQPRNPLKLAKGFLHLYNSLEFPPHFLSTYVEICEGLQASLKFYILIHQQKYVYGFKWSVLLSSIIVQKCVKVLKLLYSFLYSSISKDVQMASHGFRNFLLSYIS